MELRFQHHSTSIVMMVIIMHSGTPVTVTEAGVLLDASDMISTVVR